MAGTVSKGFGALALTLGILLLLAGCAAAGYGFVDQKDHEDSSGPLGVAEDRDRSDFNEMLVVYGLVGAGAGLLGIVLGILLLVIGSSRAQRHLEHLAEGGA